MVDNYYTAQHKITKRGDSINIRSFSIQLVWLFGFLLVTMYRYSILLLIFVIRQNNKIIPFCVTCAFYCFIILTSPDVGCISRLVNTVIILLM